MIILVLNCGSSSIKYQVIDMKSVQEHQLLAKGQIERIGLSDGILTHKPVGRPSVEKIKDIPNHTEGINLILKSIVDHEYGVIDSLKDINAVGHRVAHGGEFFKDSAVITDQAKKQIESCFELAPLHNPANMKGVYAIENLMPDIKQIAVFDTSFHQTMPKQNYLYALPYEYYTEYRVRKYGFHGTSHRFVAKKACKHIGIDFHNSKLITCHIGNGGSVTAILNGKSFDTSMGFTPVDGLVMGTRCGNVDPSVLLYVAEKEGLSTSQINNVINKKSGLLGITGISSDMRDIKDAAANGNELAILALQIFRERIKQYIGSYAAEMGGVDAIVFTGGIGEHDTDGRKVILSNMEYMGIEFDEKANEEAYGKDMIITKPSSKVKVAVETTNEELVIALDTFRLLNN